MAHKKISYVDASRVTWTTSVEVKDDHQGTPFPGREAIQIGCLQRIANATELMAKNYSQMQSDLERYKRWWSEERAANTKLHKRISSQKGIITKLRKRLNETTTEISD